MRSAYYVVLLVLSVILVASNALAYNYDLPLYPHPLMVRYTTIGPPTPWDAYFYIWEPVSVEMYFHSYRSTVNCNGFSVPGVSDTFTPYPGQALNDIWFDTYFDRGIREAVIRAYVDYPCQGLTAHLDPSPTQSNLVYLRTDDFLRSFELGFYWQTDYNDWYGYMRTRRIRNIGCYLCCCCNELQALGVNVDPPTLNAWLYAHGGFSRGDCVDPMAVVRYARAQGVNLGFVGHIPLAEGMGRGLRCQVSVKNHKHWVTIPCLFLHVANSTVYHLMHDPMYDRHHWAFLENYSGVDTSDTRCFYRKRSTQSSGSSSSTEAQEEQQGTQQLASGTNDTPAPADWDGSSIYAATTSNVTLSLLKGGSVVAEDEEESLEDDETEELVTTSHVLTFPNAPLGDYELRITGATGTSYEVELNDYDSQMNPTNTLYTGTIGETGVVTVQFEHNAEPTFWDIASIKDIPLDTRVTFMAGIVTAVLPDGFYAQPAGYRLPAVFISTEEPVSYGMWIDRASGLVGERNGSKCLIADDVSVEFPYGDPVYAVPVGVTAEKANTTFHLFAKTWGNVTETDTDHIVLSDALTIPCVGTDYEVGSTVSALGVEDEGTFYVGDTTNGIQVLAVPEEESMAGRPVRPELSPVLRQMTNDRIEWATQQSDGTGVQLHCEWVTDVSSCGSEIREMSGPPNASIHVLGNWALLPGQTLDLEGTMTTLSDGSRGIVASHVWIYTDSRGKPLAFPIPIKDPYGNVISDWLWKTEAIRL